MQKRLLKERIIAAKFENKTLSGELVPLIDLQDSLSKFFLAIRQHLEMMRTALATDLEGIDEYHEREAIISKRLDQHLEMVASCRWLEQKTPKE